LRFAWLACVHARTLPTRAPAARDSGSSSGSSPDAGMWAPVETPQVRTTQHNRNSQHHSNSYILCISV
jgi:hypothetical protein